MELADAPPCHHEQGRQGRTRMQQQRQNAAQRKSRGDEPPRQREMFSQDDSCRERKQQFYHREGLHRHRFKWEKQAFRKTESSSKAKVRDNGGKNGFQRQVSGSRNQRPAKSGYCSRSAGCGPPSEKNCEPRGSSDRGDTKNFHASSPIDQRARYLSSLACIRRLAVGVLSF